MTFPGPVMRHLGVTGELGTDLDLNALQAEGVIGHLHHEVLCPPRTG